MNRYTVLDSEHDDPVEVYADCRADAQEQYIDWMESKSQVHGDLTILITIKSN